MAANHDQQGEIGGSLRMREPQALAGGWIVTTSTGTCAVTFGLERLETANAWRLDDPSGCAAVLVPGVAGWRPAPEGVELVGTDRRTLVVFTATTSNQSGEATLAAGPATLRRP